MSEILDDLTLERETQPLVPFEPWRSPLALLASDGGIKWLTQKEKAWLQNYLGAGGAEEGPPSEEATASGLAGDQRFPLAFWRTLLRADVFGEAQASIVGKLRKRAAGDKAVQEVMSAITPDAFTTAKADYIDIRNQLQLEGLAALAALLEVGAIEALVLLNTFAGQDGAAKLIGHLRAPNDDPDAEDEMRVGVDRLPSGTTPFLSRSSRRLPIRPRSAATSRISSNRRVLRRERSTGQDSAKRIARISTHFRALSSAH